MSAAAGPGPIARVEAAFRRIAEVDRPEIWITLRDRDDVLAEARSLEHRLRALDGERRLRSPQGVSKPAPEHPAPSHPTPAHSAPQHPALPLAGLVVAVKDNIDVLGLPTTAGSRSFTYEPTADATSIARLRAAGAIVIGKTNLDQFATGLVGVRSPFGAVRNAWDASRISGGSSSGSAVAVALGIVDLALGTDTAGSGRVPAALNGLVGVKPTRGLIPTTGVVPACRTLDCVTVFGRDLGLARLAAEAMSGVDGVDELARDDRVDVSGWPEASGAIVGGRNVVLARAVPRIAVPTAEHLAGLAPGWAAAFAAAVTRFAATGAEIVEVDIAPLLEAATLLYEGAFVAERYAAVGAHIDAHPELVGTDLDPTVAGIVRAGARFTAAQLFDDQQRLERLGAAGIRALAGCTALLTPTTTWHPTIAEVLADPLAANSRMGRFTNFANLLDMASLAFPAGDVDGLPFGVMLTGPAFSDRSLAGLAATFAAPSIPLVVVGAHLSGQPLNRQLVVAGGSLVGPVQTAAAYRLFALETVPPKPGLVRVSAGGAGARAPDGGESGAGGASAASIAGELWMLPAAGFGTFVAALPAPMAIGTVELDDGSLVPGFVVEPFAVDGARDITGFGGWRAFLASGV